MSSFPVWRPSFIVSTPLLFRPCKLRRNHSRIAGIYPHLSVSCVANYRAKILRFRATATNPESNAPSQSIPGESTISKPPGSKKKTSLVGLLFLVITLLWSILLIIPMAIAHPFVLWLDRASRRFQDFIALLWMKCSLFTYRMVPMVVNTENLPPKDTPAIMVANHSSYLDIYVFAYLNRRIKYLSKSEIFKLPVIGWAMQMAGHISLRRMDRSGQMEAYRKMVSVIRNGVSLVVFPEGTRSQTGKLRRFQMGAFRAAKQSGAPIVPVTILGTREVMPSHAMLPLQYPSKPITLTVHPAIDSTRHTVDELRDKCFEAIDSALPPELQTGPLSKH